MRIVSPSMLAADFLHLEREIKVIEQSAAEWLHIDVMDGIFVPNISFGFGLIKSIRKCTTMFLDVHLMIVNPERYLSRFVQAGADIVTFHLEATENPMECIHAVKNAGCKVGISIKPATDVETLRDYLPLVDMVLIMSVEPGFGGQKFIPEALDKARRLREMIEECGADVIVEMDGGITAQNSREVFDSGVDVAVAGSAVFGADDPKDAVLQILNS